VLKNDVAAVRMHYVSGNQELVRASLPPEALTQDGLGTSLSQLRISQRMRLDPSQLDQVSKRMEVCTRRALSVHSHFASVLHSCGHTEPQRLCDSYAAISTTAVHYIALCCFVAIACTAERVVAIVKKQISSLFDGKHFHYSCALCCITLRLK